MAIMCSRYSMSPTFLWPWALFYMCFVIQVFIAFKFFEHPVETVSEMFEPAQFAQVATIIDLAIANNLKLNTLNYTGTALDPVNYPSSSYQKVHVWTNNFCMERNVPQEYMDVIVFWGILLLVGKVMYDLSAFQEQVQNLMRIDSGVSADKIDEEDEDALAHAAAVPATNTEITCIASRSLYIAIFTVLLPQLLFQVFFVYVGAKFLVHQVAIMGLIRGALKVYFVIKFDGFLFKAFTADNFKKLVKGAVFKVKNFEEAKPEIGWFQTVGKIFLQFLGAVIIAVTLQAIFGNVRTLGFKCDDYRAAFNLTEARNYKRSIPCLWNATDESCSMDPFQPFSS